MKLSGAKFFVLVFYSDPARLDGATKKLQKKTGKIDFMSPQYHLERIRDPFQFHRWELALPFRFYGFRRPIKPAAIALLSGRLEGLALDSPEKKPRTDQFSRIIPGYVTRQNVVTVHREEDFCRVSLNKGFFGQCQLVFEAGSFRSVDFSQNEFRLSQVVVFFNELRRRHLREMGWEENIVKEEPRAEP